MTILALLAVFAFGQAPASSVPDSQQVIGFLNRSVSWYRHFPVEQQLAAETSDLSYLEDDRRLSSQIVRLSFDFARADADLLAKEKGAPEGQEGSAALTYQSLTNLADKAEKQVKQLQGEIESLRRKLETAGGKERDALHSALAETESELGLAQTRREVMHNMLEFVSGANATGSGATGLRGQIEELEKTVPGISAKDAEPGSGAGTSRAASGMTSRPQPAGLVSLTTDVLALSRKARALQDAIRMTDELAQASKQLRAPLGASLKAIAQQSDALADQPDSTDPVELAQQKAEFDSFTTRFKQQAAAVLPLAKQRILLELYSHSLNNWHTAVRSQYSMELKSLLLRLGLLAGMMGLVLGGSGLWRRAIFRYIQDSRRRHQLMLFRRVAVWSLMAMILAFAFAGELGSLATFAGLMTAGIALALQSVIISIVGYFFLIGKYGVRIGDRIQIAGVNGEVVEMGLVRLHVMELGSDAVDAQPTGRVVAVANAAVFQATSGIFRRIPGTSFVWHEITLQLETRAEIRSVEERLLGAATQALAEYQEELEGQRRRMAKALNSATVRSLSPSCSLRLTQTGMEFVIRYPLESEKAAVVDSRVARALLDAIAADPELKLLGTGSPVIQPSAM